MYEYSEKQKHKPHSVGVFVYLFVSFCFLIESFSVFISNKLSNVYELITKRLCARLTIVCLHTIG